MDFREELRKIAKHVSENKHERQRIIAETKKRWKEIALPVLMPVIDGTAAVFREQNIHTLSGRRNGTWYRSIS